MQFPARVRVLACMLAASMCALAADPAIARVVHKAKPKRAEVGKKKKIEPQPKGTLQIVVSIGDQRVTVYSDGAPFAAAPVSTGRRSHPTPKGVFSVIQKRRRHFSNLYDSAPMPFMQRLTWSGVALHAGPLPGYPASHGCIRLPRTFAQKLWRYTKMGARVIVAQRDVPPVEISHPNLFVPEVPPVLPEIGKADVALKGDWSIRTAVSIDPTKATDAPGPAAKVSAVAATAKSATETAEHSEQVAIEPDISYGWLSEADLAAVKPPERKIPEGRVSVFISRKTAKLYVRKGTVPMFETAVLIRDPDRPFGTHVFTAMEGTDGGMRWTVQTLPPEPRRKAKRRAKPGGKAARKSRKQRLPVEEAALPPPPPASEVLNRIEMPEHAFKRISKWLTPGSSLIVSDRQMSHETGEYTDFIVVTR